MGVKIKLSVKDIDLLPFTSFLILTIPFNDGTVHK